jgi:hypothetical protein
MAVEGFQGGSRGDTSAFMPYMRINLQVCPIVILYTLEEVLEPPRTTKSGLAIFIF